jgi:hypothetical protein
MGLDTNGIKFILACKKHGVSFKDTMMIGRQILNADKNQVEENLKGFGLYESDNQVNNLLSENKGYAESLLKMLGSETIDSLDYSNYEGANILHDMNLPVPNELKEKYSTVLESGSLEHIFNFPTSMANCMEMTKKDGHLIIITPVNNIMGHGFFQFSPEVFYRVLGERSGFKIEMMLIFEYSPDEKWYSVSDPKLVKQRVELMNSSATYLCVLAKRIEIKDVLHQFPQQSDYEDAWEGRENYYTRLAQDRDSLQKPIDTTSSRKIIKTILPKIFVDTYRAYVQAKKVKFDPKFYTEIDIWTV